ncbi:hypothetical protein GCM10007049_01700 [Echinicola pacifica]|uniref:Uncharacterized protein n=1 Tax=Echinicola pacifica TaxID=346377 RepID=A0A918PL96_9BACT|nr:hypothetical protein GCM10007049_01700 [Echinicola pacifica]
MKGDLPNRSIYQREGAFPVIFGATSEGVPFTGYRECIFTDILGLGQFGWMMYLYFKSSKEYEPLFEYL